MNFFHHTTSWIRGELFEATLIFSFGLFTVLAGFLFWKYGATPASRALLLPLLITGLIYTAIGGTMRVSNFRRLPQYEAQFQKEPKAFIAAEKKRVEDFQYGYTISKLVASLFFPATLLIFWSTKNPTWQGIGIGLSIFALAGLVVDYFSQERADVYYQAVLEALQP